MKCDKCNNESNFEIHFYDGEKHRVINLCKDCYYKYVSEIFPNSGSGFDFSRFQDFLRSDEGRALTDLLRDALDIKVNFDFMNRTQNDNSPNETEKNKDPDRCPNCFKTLDEIKEDKKFGCSECYTTFKDRLDKDFLLEMANVKENEQDEKTEEKEENKEIKILINKIEKKEEALKDSINKEEFEEAAELRDEINKLKTELENLQ